MAGEVQVEAPDHLGRSYPAVLGPHPLKDKGWMKPVRRIEGARRSPI